MKGRIFFILVILVLMILPTTIAQDTEYEDYIGVRLGEKYDFELISYKIDNEDAVLTYRNMTYPGYDVGDSLNLTNGDLFSIYFDENNSQITGRNIHYAEYQIISNKGNVSSYSVFSQSLGGNFVETTNWDERAEDELNRKYQDDNRDERDSRDRSAVINTSTEFGVNKSLYFDNGNRFDFEFIYEKTTGVLFYMYYSALENNGSSHEFIQFKRLNYERDFEPDFERIPPSSEKRKTPFNVYIFGILFPILILIRKKI